MANNIANPFIVSDNLGSKTSQSTGVPTGSSPYTVSATDNLIVCQNDSVTINLASTSNSPVAITAWDGTTLHSGCLVAFGGHNWTIGTNGPTAWCVRYGDPSANLWAVIGAVSIS
jgi:hypothetical protein